MASIIHYMTASDEFGRAAQRLSMALRFHGLTGAKVNDLLDAMVEDLERSDFEYAHTLLHSSDDRAWYLVTTGAAAGAFRARHDPYSVADSLAQALGFVLEGLDDARVFPASVSVSQDAIEFTAPGGLVAKIEPIVFEPSSQQQRARVEKTLRGLRQYGEDDRWCARLSDLPGLGGLSGHRPVDLNRPPRGAVGIKTPANLCFAVRTLLKDRFGIETKLSLAQELTAAVFGAKSWQHLVARADQDCCWLSPVLVGVLCDPDNPESWERDLKFYRTSAEAVWGFAQTINHWTGKPLVPSYAGINTGGGVVDLMTQGPGYDDSLVVSDENIITSYDPPVESCGDRYLDIAETILSDPDNTASRLREHFGAGLSTGERLRFSNQRMGIATDKELRLGSWLFTLRAYGEQTTDLVLNAENFDSAGKCVAKHATAVYKAEIKRLDDSGGMAVFGDYGRRVDIPLDDLSRDEVQALAEFAGIQRWVS